MDNFDLLFRVVRKLTINIYYNPPMREWMESLKGKYKKTVWTPSDIMS
jgi:hypothetical protein